TGDEGLSKQRGYTVRVLSPEERQDRSAGTTAFTQAPEGSPPLENTAAPGNESANDAWLAGMPPTTVPNPPEGQSPDRTRPPHLVDLWIKAGFLSLGVA